MKSLFHEVMRKVELVGDRECPECEEYTLIEEGLTKWKCLKCGEIFDETLFEGDAFEIELENGGT